MKLFITLLMVVFYGGVRAEPSPLPSPLPVSGLTGDILFRFLVAEISLARGQVDLSVDTYRDLVHQTTALRDPRLVRRATEIAYHARRLDVALELATRWNELEPKSLQAQHMIAALLVAAGKKEELARFVNDHPDALEVRLAYARLLINEKRYDEARKVFTDFLKAAPDNTDALYAVALLSLQSGQFEVAEQHFKRLLELRYPGAPAVRLYLAQLYRQTARHAEVFEVLNEGLSSQPDQPELIYETALAADRIGKLDVMERLLRRLLELKPDHAHAYNALGYALAERGERLDEAQTLIETAVRLAPTDPFILDSLGWVRYRRGDTAGALESLRVAFDMKADPEIAAHLGEVLWILGRQEEARQTWRDAMIKNPDSEALTATLKKFAP